MLTDKNAGYFVMLHIKIMIGEYSLSFSNNHQTAPQKIHAMLR